MEQNKVNIWLTMNADKFRQQDLAFVRNKLETMSDDSIMYLPSASLKKPSTIFLIALLLGWERFFLDDTGLGILKIITGYGCGIWWLIDIFTAKKRAQKYNFQQFQKTTTMAGGGISAPIVTTAYATDSETQPTTQPQQYNYAMPTTQSKGNSGGKIVLIIVTIAVLVGGGLFAYHNWDSWFAPDVPAATDIMNLYNNQINNINKPSSSSLEDIFSEAQKTKQVEKGTVEAKRESTPQTEQKNSNTTRQQTYSGNNNSAYSLNSYLLTESDLHGLSKQDLRILRNEIYARHGRKFKTKDLQDYFSKQSWYQPLYNEVQLNTIEQKNVEFIRRHE